MANKDSGKNGKDMPAASAMETVGVFEMISPYIEQAMVLVDRASPYVQVAVNGCIIGWEKLQPYKPKEWGPTLFGLLLVFFGGRFLTTMAAFEAVRLIGFKKILVHTDKLWDNYQAGRAAAAKDISKGEVAKDDTKQKAERRVCLRDDTKQEVLVMLKSVEPNEVVEAFSGLYGVMLAVVATLRFKFAAAVTLGCSIGDMFTSSAMLHGKPLLLKSVPAEYHKWVDPSIRLVCQFVGVSAAWMLQRVISALHCSMRGAYIVVIQSQKAAVRMGYLQKVLLTEDSPGFPLVVNALAGLGFLNQVAYGFSLPVLLQLVFLPLYLLEFFLTQFIGTV